MDHTASFSSLLMKHEPELTEPHMATESLFLHVPFRPAGSRASCLECPSVPGALAVSSRQQTERPLTAWEQALCVLHALSARTGTLVVRSCEALDPTLLCPDGVLSPHRVCKSDWQFCEERSLRDISSNTSVSFSIRQIWKRLVK